MQQELPPASSQISSGPPPARSFHNPPPAAAHSRHPSSMSSGSTSLSTGQSSSSGHSHSSSQSTIGANAVLGLVQLALDQAKREARRADIEQHPGLTIDLSHQRIAHISLEVISLIKDDIERLALAHNRLTGFSDAFSQLSRLRYLNLRSNQIREFPLPLCKLPSLEILDISRNQLAALPPDLGNLMGLKVLSMSKNQIEELPTYIGRMHDLKILKIDHNPIMFPPRDVMELAGDGEDFRDNRLELIKRYLRNDESKGSKETESTHSSDDGEPDYSHLTVKPFQSAHNQGLPSQPRPPPIPSRSQQRSLSQKRIGRLEGTNSLPGPPTLSATGYLVPNGAQANSSQHSSSHERSRSNSESTVQHERANKRMGNIFARKEKLVTVDESKTAKHHHVRGYSHDSIIENQHRTASHEKPSEQISASRSPTDPDRPTAGHYFRRLSSLPEQKRSSMSTARVAESARGILYSLSQSHTAVSIFINNSGDRSRHAPLERVLFFANNQIGNLVRALESYDAKGDEHAVEPVLAACTSCLAAFRQVMLLLQASLREISSESDVRLTRTLLLMIYGTSVELQNSWAALRPILPQPPSANNYFHAAGHGRHIGLPGNVRMKSISNSSSISLVSNASSIPPPLATPRSPDATFQVPPTPSIASSLYMSENGSPENDEALFENVNAATIAALSTLPQITDAITKMAIGQSLHPNTMIKMKELDTLCSNTKETARRLKGRLDTIREFTKEGNTVERKRFWDDTNLFIKSIIDIAEICKILKSEHPFPNTVTNNISLVIRHTKSLSILNAVSSFRQFKEDANNNSASANHLNGASSSSLTPFYQPLNQLTSTPLSAALGAAAQATVPSHPYPNGLGLGLGGGGESRSETMLSSVRTMTSTSSSTAFSVSLGGGSGGAGSGGGGGGGGGGVNGANGVNGNGSGNGNGSAVGGPMSPTKEMKVAPSLRFGSTST